MLRSPSASAGLLVAPRLGSSSVGGDARVVAGLSSAIALSR